MEKEIQDLVKSESGNMINSSSATRKKIPNRDRCAVCYVYRTDFPNRKFFKFPIDPDMSHKWKTECNRPYLMSKTSQELNKSYKLCSNHFTAENYASPKMCKLKSSAFPTQFDFIESNSENLPVSVLNLQTTVKDKLTLFNESEFKIDLSSLQPIDCSTPKRRNDDISSPSKRIKLAFLQPRVVELSCSEEMQNSEMAASTDDYHTGEEIKYLTPKTKKIRLLSSKVQYLQRKYKKSMTKDLKMKIVLETIKKHVTPTVFFFIQSQLKSSSIAARGRRYTINDKKFALQLYLSSPRAYHTLGRYFILPSKKTLLKCVSGINVEVGFSDVIFESLRHFSKNMKTHDRLCIISFDEVKIKKGLAYNEKLDQVIGFENFFNDAPSQNLATHALVFMVRGICRRWKQTIGFFFSSDTAPSHVLKVLLIEAIEKLFKCGLEPVAVVCDQGSNNQKLYNTELSITPEKPYFFFKEKIFCLCDPPHLLKCIRNNFMKYNVKFNNGQIASWQHIIDLYFFDSKLTHRYLTKLTRRHMFVDGLSKMRVSLVAQVLSNSVAAGLCTLSTAGTLPQAANFTADFCKVANDLFDSVNSRVLTHKTRPLLSAATKSSSHLQTWQDMMKFIESVEFQTGDQEIRFPCLTGWKITLSCFIQLVPLLLEKVTFVLLSRFNQDGLENFFSQVRRKGGNADNPTPMDFVYRMRMLLAQNIIATFENTNCEADQDFQLLPMELLTKIHSEQNSLVIDETSVNEVSSSSPAVDSNLEIHKKNTAEYVAGYMCHILLKSSVAQHVTLT